MITRIEGTLESVHTAHVVVATGNLAYEIFVPSALIAELHSRKGERVVFHTLHYLESQGQGASFWPKLVGFATVEDREFFELVTSVKGIGVRRALRALTIPFPRIAEAILMKDLAILTSLPEIGRKTAETMVVDLREKVERFASPMPGVATADASAAPGKGTAKRTTPPPATTIGSGLNAATVLDAVNVLVQLGESRGDARLLIDKAIERDPAIGGADGLVSAALACKGSR